MLEQSGLKVASQQYNYNHAGLWKNGTNIYGIIQAPRADATEAMVLLASSWNMDEKINYSGLALVFSLARYFKRWSLWSKDIIVVISPDSTFGPRAWVDAYHDAHDQKSVAPLSIKSGALQGAVAIDYPAPPWGQRFEKLHIVYDGVNGQLPNLDLVNSVVNIANNQGGMDCTVQKVHKHNSDAYMDRLSTLFRGMMSQAIGHSSGAHSSFMSYHVDAITIQTVGEDGPHDEMSLGRLVEGTMRSLNNLLEHFHQSFFFYFMMHSLRFVSIGTYLPSAMLLAGNFTISAMFLWFLSGRPALKSVITHGPPKIKKANAEAEIQLLKSDKGVVAVPKVELETADRDLMKPLLIVLGFHLLGLYIFYIQSGKSVEIVYQMKGIATVLSIICPIGLSIVITSISRLTHQHVILVQTFSLLFLGGALSTLATINFSQALFIGLATSPLSFVRPIGRNLRPMWRILITIPVIVLFSFLTPMGAIGLTSHIAKISVKDILIKLAWAWKVEGVWTGLLMWLIWYPAWCCGLFTLLSGLIPFN